MRPRPIPTSDGQGSSTQEPRVSEEEEDDRRDAVGGSHVRVRRRHRYVSYTGTFHQIYFGTRTQAFKISLLLLGMAVKKVQKHQKCADGVV